MALMMIGPQSTQTCSNIKLATSPKAIPSKLQCFKLVRVARVGTLAYLRYRLAMAKLERFLPSNYLPKIMLPNRRAIQPNGCTRAAIRVKYMIQDHANGFALQHHLEFAA
jgi:hypothetical protein